MVKIFVVEQERLLSAKGGRVPADIDQDIVDGTVCAAHQLGLASARPSVHAADDPLGRTGLGVLDKGSRDTGSSQLVVEDLGVERPSEQSTLVTKWLWDEDQHVGEVSSFDTHTEMLS